MIFINGFVEVKLLGLYLLVVFSEEGIYIGVDIVVGKLKVNEDKVVGGYCVRNLCVLGNMFYLEIVLNNYKIIGEWVFGIMIER